MVKKHSERQRQTQLAFAPLPPSSPARASQPEAVRDRVAAVVLSMSPRQAWKKTSTSGYMPTPSRSSQVNSDHWPELTLESSPLMRPVRKSFMSSANKTSSPASRRSSQKFSHFDASDQSESDASELTLATSKEKTAITNDSDSDEVIVQSAKKRRRTESLQIVSDGDRAPAHRSKRIRKTSTLHDNSDSDVVITAPPKKAKATSLNESESDAVISRHSRKSIPSSSIQETDSDSDIVVTRLSRNLQKSSQFARQDQEDLEEDLEFLKSMDTPPPTRKPEKQSAKRRALDTLRKRRSQQHAKRTATATDSSLVFDSDQEDSDNDNQSDADEALSENFDEATYLEGEDLDQDVDDFVIHEEDDNSLIGARVDLPVQYSRYQTMKPAELFKFAVEWMVQKKLNPAFETDDEIYLFTFARLNDFVSGLGGSKYQSAAWTSNFSKSVKSRPELEDHQFLNSGLLHDRCDACNRSGHPATWEVRFHGNCYDKNSLEEESDEDSDEESPSVPSANTTYYVGKVCMQNARTAHALAHWRFHLNQWVVDYLKEEGYCTAAKIVQRDGWSIKRRRKYANKVVDRMEADGEIKRLHRDFRNEVDTAARVNVSLTVQ